MLRVPCCFLLVVLPVTLFVLVFGQPASAPLPAPQIINGGTDIEWPGVPSDARCLLTVSGPAGIYMRQEHPEGAGPRFSLADSQGQARADGVYKWEIVFQTGWEDGGQVQTGWFELQGGKVAAQGPGDRRAVAVEDGARPNSLRVDSQGRVGIGTWLPAAQLHLKGSSPSLIIEDTQAGGREYSLRSGEKGSLGLFDEATGKAGWLVDSEGRVGIGTIQPTSTLTVDGYIESTKGFLVNGRPLPLIAGFGGVNPLSTEGSSNNFFGTGAGAANTALYNSFFGGGAGQANTSGSANSFFGRLAGRNNTTGATNSFFGEESGYQNTTGEMNSFFGRVAGLNNTTGLDNSFFGGASGFGNTTGQRNSFFGKSAGSNNTVESNNTFLGVAADLDPGADPAGD